MTTPVWPVSLPAYLEVDDFELSLPATVVRTPMEAGPAKARRRFTAAPTPVKGSIVVDATQLAAFRAFHDDTLEGGALRFDWVHPVTRASCTMRFRGTPSVRALGNAAGLALTRVGLDLEILP